MRVIRYVKELFDLGIQSVVKNIDGTTTTVSIGYSHETLKMHIKALVDLHHKQKIENQPDIILAHPRGEALRSFERSLKRLCSAKRVKENFVDPGIGSIQDGYDGEQLVQVANYYLSKKKWLEMHFVIE